MVDQYRSVKKGNGLLLGANANPSMTWEDVWGKYEAQIIEQELSKASVENAIKQHKDKSNNSNMPNGIDEEELMMRIYMRILEKSCATNQAFDSVFLKEDGEDEESLALISSRLEEDIYSILLSPKEADEVMKRRNKVEKRKAKIIEKEEKQRLKAVEKEAKLKRKLEKRMRKLSIPLEK